MLLNTLPINGTQIFGTPTDGDLVRYNSTTGHWESRAEPISFQQIILTPTDTPMSDAEGSVYYDQSDKKIYVSVG